MFQSGDLETLAKPAGAAEEIDLSLCRQLIDHIGLIHIDKSHLPDLVETLHANGVFHIAHLFRNFQRRRYELFGGSAYRLSCIYT